MIRRITLTVVALTCGAFAFANSAKADVYYYRYPAPSVYVSPPAVYLPRTRVYYNYGPVIYPGYSTYYRPRYRSTVRRYNYPRRSGVIYRNRFVY